MVAYVVALYLVCADCSRKTGRRQIEAFFCGGALMLAPSPVKDSSQADIRCTTDEQLLWADCVEIGRTFDPQRRRVGAENQWQPVCSANVPTVE
jgi:hypothetical protein